MLTYAYTLTPDSNGTYLIQYPDLPEGAAVSETEKAGPDAAEGLDAVLQLYIDARRPIPMPTDVGDGSVSLGAMRTAKVLLANEMVRQGVRKADLARRLGVHAPGRPPAGTGPQLQDGCHRGGLQRAGQAP